MFLAILIAAPAVAFVLAVRSNDTATKPPTLAELVRKNYRTLSVAESRRLLRYAEREYECLAANDAAISKPIASRTRITMRAPHRTVDELIQLMSACDPEVGPPPKRASLQARQGVVLVYVPKRCLLDPAAVTSTAS